MISIGSQVLLTYPNTQRHNVKSVKTYPFNILRFFSDRFNRYIRGTNLLSNTPCFSVLDVGFTEFVQNFSFT